MLSFNIATFNREKIAWKSVMYLRKIIIASGQRVHLPDTTTLFARNRHQGT